MLSTETSRGLVQKKITERRSFTQGVLKLWNSLRRDVVDAKIWVQEGIVQIHERKKSVEGCQVPSHCFGIQMTMSPILLLGEIAVNASLHLCAYLGIWPALKRGQYQ